MSRNHTNAKRAGRSGRYQVIEPLKPRLHEALWVQVLLLVWRWHIELVAVAAVAWCWFYLDGRVEPWLVVTVLVGTLVVLLAVPLTRRYTVGWLWCLVSRHRLRAFLVQTGARNRSGKLPWILAAYPTPVGERLWVLMIAGMAVDDLQPRLPALAATCWARDARMDRTRRTGALVRIDVIRRDPLAASKPLASTLVAGKPDSTDDVVVSAGTVKKNLPDWVRNAPSAADLGLVPDGTGYAHPAPPWKAGIKKPATTGTTATAAQQQKSTKPATGVEAPGVVFNGEDVSDYV